MRPCRSAAIIQPPRPQTLILIVALLASRLSRHTPAAIDLTPGEGRTGGALAARGDLDQAIVAPDLADQFVVSPGIGWDGDGLRHGSARLGQEQAEGNDPGLHEDCFRRRTPAPPPFSGMNSTPAASRAARMWIGME